MIEVFSHDVSVRPDAEAEDVFIISGKDWENEEFNLYIRKEEAASLLWQLDFYIYNVKGSSS